MLLISLQLRNIDMRRLHPLMSINHLINIFCPSDNRPALQQFTAHFFISLHLPSTVLYAYRAVQKLCCYVLMHRETCCGAVERKHVEQTRRLYSTSGFFCLLSLGRCWPSFHIAPRQICLPFWVACNYCQFNEANRFQEEDTWNLDGPS
jgi:hypothetical protein